MRVIRWQLGLFPATAISEGAFDRDLHAAALTQLRESRQSRSDEQELLLSTKSTTLIAVGCWTTAITSTRAPPNKRRAQVELC